MTSTYSARVVNLGTPRPTLIAVTGSKGGVGKTSLVVNLAVSLASKGVRVTILDGCLGSANVDVLLRLMPTRTVEHFLSGQATFEEIVCEGPAGIRVVPAATGIPGLGTLPRGLRERLREAVATSLASADIALVDTGREFTETAKTLQLLADRLIVVTTTEPPSLIGAYSSIKVLCDADPGKRIDLVVSKVASQEEARNAYQRIARACGHFLQREVNWLGSVYADEDLIRSIHSQRPLVEQNPNSPAALCFERIANRLLGVRHRASFPTSRKDDTARARHA